MIFVIGNKIKSHLLICVSKSKDEKLIINCTLPYNYVVVSIKGQVPWIQINL